MYGIIEKKDWMIYKYCGHDFDFCHYLMFLIYCLSQVVWDAGAKCMGGGRSGPLHVVAVHTRRCLLGSGRQQHSVGRPRLLYILSPDETCPQTWRPCSCVSMSTLCCNCSHTESSFQGYYTIKHSIFLNQELIMFR